MYSLKDAELVIKYDILATWLVERLENEEKIDRDELERLLSALNIRVEHNICKLKEDK